MSRQAVLERRDVLTDFSGEDDAMMCLRSKDLKNCDLRWRKETDEVLEYIGDSHPVFILSVTEAITYRGHYFLS